MNQPVAQTENSRPDPSGADAPPARQQAKRAPSPYATEVVRIERLSESMVRVEVRGDGLAEFGEPLFADAYVKLMFLDPDTHYPRPIDVEQIRATMPRSVWPRLRTYTIRYFDRAARSMTIDFVVHGDQGLAGPWAARAQPGDELLILGPGGGYSPDPTADFHLLIGDESALPAIAAAMERLGPDADARVFVEVYGPADTQRLPDTAEVTWIHRGLRPVGAALVDAVSEFEFPSGRVSAFVHGEAGFVKDLRRLLKVDRGIPMDQLSISGYWRLGADDEAWRAVKRDWNAAIEAEQDTTA